LIFTQLATRINQEKREQRCTTWQIFVAARRFKPKQEQHPSLMCRLAVGIEPPGGFWEKAQEPQ